MEEELTKAIIDICQNCDQKTINMIIPLIIDLIKSIETTKGNKNV